MFGDWRIGQLLYGLIIQGFARELRQPGSCVPTDLFSRPYRMQN
jgi:hypothetical protein